MMPLRIGGTTLTSATCTSCELLVHDGLLAICADHITIVKYKNKAVHIYFTTVFFCVYVCAHMCVCVCSRIPIAEMWLIFLVLQ